MFCKVNSTTYVDATYLSVLQIITRDQTAILCYNDRIPWYTHTEHNGG